MVDLNIFADMKAVRMPAEWEEQSGIVVIWPHGGTDWHPMLPEVNRVYLALVSAIAQSERVVIISPAAHELSHRLGFCMAPLMANITLVELPTNDTWARDCLPLSVWDFGKEGQEVATLCDFCFNGWGGKFASELDNQLGTELHRKGLFRAVRRDQGDFVLEGGSIESDGHGTLLTTARCLLGTNRNPHLTQSEIEQRLRQELGVERILWLHHGALAGDDTDGHVDMLARFVRPDSIAYTSCNDPSYPYYNELKLMEQELRGFCTKGGRPYNLIPLPLPLEGELRNLPCSYANFLIANETVLLPDYGADGFNEVKSTLQHLFPTRAIRPIPARTLIGQGGSVHCATMQIPKNFLR